MLSTLTGQAAGKTRTLRKVFFHSDQGEKSGPWKRGQLHLSKDRLCHGQSQNSGKKELESFKKHSLIHLGVTTSGLWKGLEHLAEPDFCLRDPEMSKAPGQGVEGGWGLWLGLAETPRGPGCW